MSAETPTELPSHQAAPARVLPNGAQASQVQTLLHELEQVQRAMLALEAQYDFQIRALAEDKQQSARNLIHYLAFRQFDLRRLQEHLAALGLSSLGRAESHVLSSIEQVLGILRLLAGSEPTLPAAAPGISFAEGRQLLVRHTEALFGPPLPTRHVRIMVTMPSEAASDPTLMHNMLAAGMECMRINCAHDDVATWQAMVARLREAEQALGKPCKVLMDLAGPKLRTGPVLGPPVVKCQPQRDEWGRVTQPARIWFSTLEAAAIAPAPADASLNVAARWLARVAVGDAITFKDTRGLRRTLKVVDQTENGRWAETTQTCYFTPDLLLRHRPRKRVKGGKGKFLTPIGPLVPRNPSILLRRGDRLRITSSQEPGHDAVRNADGVAVVPATIGCTLPEVFQDVRPGESIWLDDGKIGGRICAVSPDGIDVEITAALDKGARLRADKGINLPDSFLRLPALTEKDLRDLEEVVQLADMVGLSFVRSTDDVTALQLELQRLGSPDLGIVLKLETRRAFEQLPQLLLAALQSRAAGVMIARGDLAVESGFERLAEVQEEIRWISEAAHLPTIWATQVLETLAGTGLSTRAEITDAAQGERAECVMLNKGPYIVDAIRTLDDVLRRMQGHQHKSVALLRQLRSWTSAVSSLASDGQL